MRMPKAPKQLVGACLILCHSSLASGRTGTSYKVGAGLYRLKGANKSSPFTGGQLVFSWPLREDELLSLTLDFETLRFYKIQSQGLYIDPHHGRHELYGIGTSLYFRLGTFYLSCGGSLGSILTHQKFDNQSKQRLYSYLAPQFEAGFIAFDATGGQINLAMAAKNVSANQTWQDEYGYKGLVAYAAFVTLKLSINADHRLSFFN